MLIDRDVNSPIRMLLLGSDGNVGSTLLHHMSSLNELDITPLSYDAFLTTNFSLLENQDYDVVLDAASIHKPFTDPYLNSITNCNQWASEKEIDVIMLSSAFVFSGKMAHPYEEHDETNSEHEYGKHLAIIERIVLGRQENIVLRSGWLFGGMDDFVKKTIELAKAGEPLTYRDDLLGSPTPISDLARVTLTLIKQRHYGANNSGVYHYCCAEEVTRSNYAKSILMIASQYDPNLDTSTEFFDDYAEETQVPDIERFRQSLSCRQIFNHFGVKQRPWRSSLKKLIKGLYQVN